MKNIKLDFLVIGAQKSGTTTLHELLKKENDILLPKLKETHFFSKDELYSKGEDWYLAQFPEDKNMNFQGEIDPEYLFFPKAAERIALLPNSPKIIVLLRNPIKRAFSHYRMSVRRNTESLDFPQALRDESTRESTEDNLFFAINYSYLSRSLYSNQIKRYRSLIPDGDFLFIKFEDFIGEETRHATYKKICNYIGFESALTPTDSDMKSNIASEAKYSFINKLLWDKRKFGFSRKLFRLAVPSKAIRGTIFFFLYSKNEKPLTHKSDLDIEEIPAEIIDRINFDIREVINITGLQIEDWIIPRKIINREQVA